MFDFSRNPSRQGRPFRGHSLDSRGDCEDEDEEEEDRGDDQGPRHWVYGLKEGTILQVIGTNCLSVPYRVMIKDHWVHGLNEGTILQVIFFSS